MTKSGLINDLKMEYMTAGSQSCSKEFWSKENLNPQQQQKHFSSQIKVNEEESKEESKLLIESIIKDSPSRDEINSDDLI